MYNAIIIIITIIINCFLISLYIANGRFFVTLTCFTYLKITNSRLQPMIIDGGASYILRGYGQMVEFAPYKYSVDPDYPEDKVLFQLVTFLSIESDRMQY